MNRLWWAMIRICGLWIWFPIVVRIFLGVVWLERLKGEAEKSWRDFSINMGAGAAGLVGLRVEEWWTCCTLFLGKFTGNLVVFWWCWVDVVEQDGGLANAGEDARCCWSSSFVSSMDCMNDLKAWERRSLFTSGKLYFSTTVRPPARWFLGKLVCWCSRSTSSNSWVLRESMVDAFRGLFLFFFVAGLRPCGVLFYSLGKRQRKHLQWSLWAQYPQLAGRDKTSNLL